MVNPSKLPERDLSKHAKYYDFKLRRWVYDGENEPRANSIKEPSARYKDLDDYLDEQNEDYLNEHVKGYKKKNFWGDHELDTDDEEDEEDSEIGDEPDE